MKGVSTSSLLLGIIDEVDIHKIKQPNFLFYGKERTETTELVNSIRQNGLLQPIVVRTIGDSFEIVAGCRRYRACRTLGFRKIICHIIELDDKAAFEVSLIENIQRMSLDPIEEARAFKAYVDEFGCGGLTELANKISKSTAYICKRLSLLDLPSDLLETIRKCEVSPSAAEELIPIKDSDKRHLIADLIIKNHYSSREVRKLVEMNRESQSHIDEKLLLNELSFHKDKTVEFEFKAHRSFDKSITALKIAKGKIIAILGTVEDNWLVHEILVQHKNMLNSQIDLLIKEKKKLR